MHRNTIFVEKPAAGAYIGPGDIAATGIVFWCGLRAFSAAKAGTKCVRILNNTTAAQQDFNTLANGKLDTASIATFLGAATGSIAALYDQSGNGNDVTQATVVNMPAYSTASLGGLPTILCNTANLTMLSNGGGSLAISLPVSISMVYEVADSTSDSEFAYDNLHFQQGPNANALRFFDGSNVIDTPAGSAPDGSFHAVQLVEPSAGTNASQLYIDGTAKFGTLSGNISRTGFDMTVGGILGHGMDGNICEVGVWNLDLSSPDIRSQMNSNQHGYWNF